MKIGDIDIRKYGSQGQQRTSALSLKLAEIDVFKEVCCEYPVLLLDDLFSELDLDKRKKVINYLNKDIQTIVTTTDLKNIDKHLVKSANIYKIDNGTHPSSNYGEGQPRVTYLSLSYLPRKIVLHLHYSI